MATAMKTDAEKVTKLREMAKDKTLPQDVRNQYLDQATKLEEKGAMKAGVKLAKGGMAKKPAPKKMAVGGAVQMAQAEQMAKTAQMAPTGPVQQATPMSSSNIAKATSMAPSYRDFMRREMAQRDAIRQTPKPANYFDRLQAQKKSQAPIGTVPNTSRDIQSEMKQQKAMKAATPNMASPTPKTASTQTAAMAKGGAVVAKAPSMKKPLPMPTNKAKKPAGRSGKPMMYGGMADKAMMAKGGAVKKAKGK